MCARKYLWAYFRHISIVISFESIKVIPSLIEWLFEYRRWHMINCNILCVRARKLSVGSEFSFLMNEWVVKIWPVGRNKSTYWPRTADLLANGANTLNNWRVGYNSAALHTPTFGLYKAIILLRLISSAPDLFHPIYTPSQIFLHHSSLNSPPSTSNSPLFHPISA